MDRPNRVQLVKEGGCRVTSNNEIKGSRSTAGKDVPAGTMAVVRSPDFCENSRYPAFLWRTVDRSRSRSHAEQCSMGAAEIAE